MSRLLLSLALVLTGAAACRALDQVVVERGGQRLNLSGKVQVEAEDGGLLLLAADGVLWTIPKEELVSRRSDEKPLVPLDRGEVGKQVLATLPAGFKIHATKHYLICYNTSPAYAQWVGALYERLFSAFFNYWSRRGAELHEPEFPLPVIVYNSQAGYAVHAQRELGDSAKTIIGYYSLMTNRVTMYDLTGLEAGRAPGGSAARINQLLSQPGSERTVATIVHEATHQLAFNSGLQKRLADIPFWLSEGLAIYFESPDLKSSTGWRNIGGVNRPNLLNFQKYAARRPADSLNRLITDDARFRDPAAVSDAYAEAWALSYFLLRTRNEAYVKYLRALYAQTPLLSFTADERLAEFKKHFGDDLTALDAEFVKYMRTVE